MTVYGAIPLNLIEWCFFFHLNVYLFNLKKLENHQFEMRKAKTLGATTTTIKNQMVKNNSVIKIQFTIYLRKRNKTTKCFSL